MNSNTKAILQQYGTILAVAILVLFFTISVPSFIEPNNLINILAHISMLTIIATGLTICMIPGDFDMSIAAVAGLSGVFVTSLLLKGASLAVSVAAVLLMGALFGFVAGFLVTTLRISAFIATLALSSVATGINFMYTRGQEVFGEFPASFMFLGQGKFFGVIPTQVVLMIATVAILTFFMNRTRMGRWMYAIGGSVRSAYLSGIRVNQYRVIAMMLSGALAAFTGCILASRLGSGQPTAGDAFLMDAIAAAYLGMTTIRVGRPNILGTFVGALIIGIVDNGLVLMGISYFFQYIAKGLIIVLAVSLTSRGSTWVVEK